MEAEGSGAHGSPVLMKRGRQVPAPPSDQFSQIDKFNLTGTCLKVKVDKPEEGYQRLTSGLPTHMNSHSHMYLHTCVCTNILKSNSKA